MSILSLQGNSNAVSQFQFLMMSQDILEVAQRMYDLCSNEEDPDELLDAAEVAFMSKDFRQLRTLGASGGMLSDFGSHWYNLATNVFSESCDLVLQSSAIMRRLSASQVDSIRSHMQMVLGGISYALLDTFEVFQVESTDELVQELRGSLNISEGIKAFIQDRMGGSALKYVQTLYKLYVKYPPFVPVRVEFPDVWEQFVEAMDEQELGRELLDRGDLLYLNEIQPILNKEVTVDESLMQRLDERNDSMFIPSKMYPHIFAEFLKKLPESYSAITLLFENKLSEAILRDLISGALQFNDDLLSMLSDAPTLEKLYKDQVSGGNKSLASLALAADTGVF